MTKQTLPKNLSQKQYNFIMSVRRAFLSDTHNFDELKLYRNIGKTMSFQAFKQAVNFIKR